MFLAGSRAQRNLLLTEQDSRRSGSFRRSSVIGSDLQGKGGSIKVKGNAMDSEPRSDNNVLERFMERQLSKKASDAADPCLEKNVLERYMERQLSKTALGFSQTPHTSFRLLLATSHSLFVFILNSILTRSRTKAVGSKASLPRQEIPGRASDMNFFPTSRSSRLVQGPHQGFQVI